MYYIGIDLGGTNIAVGLVNEEGRIIAKTETPTLASRPYQELVKDMAACARKVMEEANITEDELRSIGVGIPGVADKDGMVIFCTNLGWRNVPLRAELQQYINKPVYMDNDATVAGWAEYQAGVSRNTRSSVFMTLGTGLGGGIVMDGKIWAGAHGAGSELGHLVIEVDGVPCTCGKRGCAERYCSATAIIRMAREACADAPNCLIMRKVEGDMDKINAKVVFDAAKEGDSVALQVFNRFVKYLTIAINNVISFIDPDMIILGGGVSRAGDFLLDAVKAALPEYLFYPTLKQPELRIASLGNDAGIIGAALLGKE
ncbi:MAG: ROK family protein [Clostridia bacterium]|nr:ROK family protein [Clostridia bacterium]